MNTVKELNVIFVLHKLKLKMVESKFYRMRIGAKRLEWYCSKCNKFYVACFLATPGCWKSRCEHTIHNYWIKDGNLYCNVCKKIYE